MSIIKSSMFDTGVTTYNLPIDALKKLIAKDLGVPVEAIEVDHKVVSRESYGSDGYDVFAGLVIRVKNHLTKPKVETNGPQIDSPCCGENRRQ